MRQIKSEERFCEPGNDAGPEHHHDEAFVHWPCRALRWTIAPC